MCTEGMMKPCAIPMRTRAAMMVCVFLAFVGVNIDTRDQRKKEMMSVTLPP